MTRLKITALALFTAGVFMAFAGSASAAPTLTSPAGTEYTGTVTATANSSILFKATFANVTCTSATASGTGSTNNETHASGSITMLSASGCSTTIDTLVNGSLTVNQKGEVFGSNSRVTMVAFGVDCVFGTTTNTKLGTLTGGTPAKGTLSATLPLLEGSAFACGSTGTWSGGYTVTTPGTLLVT